MCLSTIITTLCVIAISRLSTIQSADIINPGDYRTKDTYECSGDCNIICSAYQGCYDSLFIITNTVPIWINCTGQSACDSSVFYYGGSARVDHLCNDTYTCHYTTFYAFNPFHLHCNDGFACKTSALIDLVPPASGQVSITLGEDSTGSSSVAGMSVFSFYHQGQILYCPHSCNKGEMTIYYGLKFDEYCMDDDSSCISAQSAVSDDVYGAYTIMDTLSGAYGTNYDFSAYTMDTNVLLVLADYKLESAATTFVPPIMDDNSTILSVICVECRDVTLDFSSVHNAILTGAKLYASSNAVVEGPSGTLMVNSRHPSSIYRTQFNLDAYTNVAITIHSLQDAAVNLGTNVDVEVYCYGGTSAVSNGCNNVNLHSDVDPYSTDFTNFIVLCAPPYRCDYEMYTTFPTYAPNLTCTFTSSGVSAGCEFFDATQNPSSDSSLDPSPRPSRAPTQFPTHNPSHRPTKRPTARPTRLPTLAPVEPTQFPTKHPTAKPTRLPTSAPVEPTLAPTQPTATPSSAPSQDPTSVPSTTPTNPPTASTPSPSAIPTIVPSQHPSSIPSTSPRQRSPSALLTTLESSSVTIHRSNASTQLQAAEWMIIAGVSIGCLFVCNCVMCISIWMYKNKRIGQSIVLASKMSSTNVGVIQITAKDKKKNVAVRNRKKGEESVSELVGNSEEESSDSLYKPQEIEANTSRGTTGGAKRNTMSTEGRKDEMRRYFRQQSEGRGANNITTVPVSESESESI
eukprot:795832_1